MWNTTFKAVILISAALSITDTAQASDDPIEILLSQVELDLSKPDLTATRITDIDFKSTDPLMRSRIYALNDGTQVKLIGRNFRKSADIDRLHITYPFNETVYKQSYTALSESFGAPSAQRRGVLVWRLENPNTSSSQRETIKIIAEVDKANNHIIMTDRQRRAKGNNPRLNAHPEKPSVAKKPPARPRNPPLRSKASNF